MEIMGNEQFQNIQREHSLWMETLGKDGMRMRIGNVDFAMVDLSEADFRMAVLRNCKFDNRSIYHFKMNQADVQDCSFKGMVPVEAEFLGSEFNNCDFSFATLGNGNFYGSTFQRCNFFHAELVRANFSHCSLASSSFAAAKWGNTNLIFGGYDLRGYMFYCYLDDPGNPDNGLCIRAGCRRFYTFPDALHHWRSSASKRDKTPEQAADCISLVVRMRTMAKARGWI